MSRLIIKNLPKHITQERFKEHFSTQGEVTDVKLAKAQDGTFRRFGYIGYKTEKMAKAALKHFNKTFIDTSRIEVEIAKAVGDASIPRPWSKYSRGSSSNMKAEAAAMEKQRKKEEERLARISKQRKDTEKELTVQEKRIAALYADKHDEKLCEFLEVMQPRSKTRTWANDDVSNKSSGDKSIKAKKASIVAVPNKKPGGDGLLMVKSHVTFDDSDDEDYQELSGLKNDNLKKLTDYDDDAGLELANEIISFDIEINDDDNDVNKEKTRKLDSISDLDYLRSKMTSAVLPDVDNEEENQNVNFELHPENRFDPQMYSKNEDSIKEDISSLPFQRMYEETNESSVTNITNNSSPHENFGFIHPSRQIPREASPAPLDIIADTGRLMVKNLPYTCTPSDIEALFSKFGPLSEVHIPIEKDSKRSRGYAFVLFMLPEHALKAFTSLDGQVFQGRIIEIIAAKEKPKPKDEEELESQSGYKKQKELKRKKNAGEESHWNSLFMNSDAVAEATAERLGVSKAELLSPDSDNVAVRLALAETHVIAETKQYLESEGVCLDAFKSNKERSNTIILIKNIPHSTTIEEIQDLFKPFGNLNRVILPPARTIALVEYLEVNEAKAAFRRLAFTKFKHVPLFLEWAPVGSLIPVEKKIIPKEENETDTVQKPAIKIPFKESKSNGVEDLLDVNDETPDSNSVSSTLFVKNINFETTNESFHKAFESCFGLRSARIAIKRDGKTGQVLSMGFGFLEFDSKENALTTLKTMQNFNLDGHILELKLSHRAADPSALKRKRAAEDVIVRGTKLIVRNIPFQTTKKDIQQLFSTFGQLKSVRIPKKFDGTHRGFGFVNFLTKQEAKAAFESLHATHLYGRHLVLEWAEDDGSVEALRERTRKGLSNLPNKKSRVNLDGDNNDGDDDSLDH